MYCLSIVADLNFLEVHLHTSFVAPVRQLLTSTKMVCRQEMEVALREEKCQRAKDGPELCVEVAGETLPKLSEKEELQVMVGRLCV